MGREEDAGGKCFPARWSVAAKPCDSCKSAAALLFCRLDSAFLCMGCDAKFHRANKIASQHEPIWICDVCEEAPASVRCKADAAAAALCITCDRDIHSANPLARRHERSPVVPFYDTVVKSTATAFLVSPTADSDNFDRKISTCVADGQPHTSLILSNTINSKHTADNPEMKSMELLVSDSDQFLDFDYSIQRNHHNSGTDSVVPDQPMKPLPLDRMMDHSPDSLIEIDFTRSNLNCFNNSYTAQSLSQSVSSSSMDVAIVPDGSSISDTSYPFALQMNSSMDPNGSTNGNQASQLSGMDREARVLRYREKKKNRKFEKTIRYASRKAYAEMRPRIKGRFAKRTAFSGDDARYGVVQSF